MMRSLVGLQLSKHWATFLEMIIATPLRCTSSSLPGYMMVAPVRAFKRPNSDHLHSLIPNIPMPQRVISESLTGLLAVETMHAIVQWLANLNIKRNMTSTFVNKKHRYCPALCFFTCINLYKI